MKHFILRNYLERFAFIVGRRWSPLVYVDCFAGPWNARSQDFGDSSFGIALEILRGVRDQLARKEGITFEFRCFFLEENREAYSKLKSFAAEVKDARIETRNARLEDSVPSIGKFVEDAGNKAFPFTFIDPTGWTGFGMDTIRPLLEMKPGEVLINFMTSHIRRFLDSPQEQTQESFRRLFGSDDFKSKVQGLSGLEREDAAVEDYTRKAKAVGNFALASQAIVLHPEKDRTHFHLIYLTRHPKGVEVFKDAEKRAMDQQEKARAEAQQRRRVERGGQLELLGSGDLADSSHYNELRSRHSKGARELVLSELKSKGRLPYDDAWALALSRPLCWESDLKGWIKDWAKQGLLKVEGMQPNQQVVRRGEQHVLYWL